MEILQPITFAFLLVGAMLPYWFSAMTMKSVGKAAMEVSSHSPSGVFLLLLRPPSLIGSCVPVLQMVAEVQRQFNEKPELLEKNSTVRPDYERCVLISTNAALK